MGSADEERLVRVLSMVALPAVGVVLKLAGCMSPVAIAGISFFSSSMLVGTHSDFDSLADRLNKEGMRAFSPAPIVGKSGVRHEFAFAVAEPKKRPTVVADVELSVRDVDEMKVLSFYVKVFDVSPEHAILCVSPRLGDKAKELAKEYRIDVIEDETPKKLIPKAADAVRAYTS